MPSLRFPEFKGAWQPTTAGQAFRSRQGRGREGLPIYSVILNRGLVPRDTLDRHLGNDAEDGANLRAEPGDLVYNTMRMRQELARLERRVRQLAQNDPVCRRLMSMPGIGAVIALTYRSAVDDPARFTSSKKVGPWIGLTPSRNQSGERDVSGGITKAGDVNLRRALRQAATVMMHRGRATWLRTWAAHVARRRGAKRAMVALARRMGVILHRMWVDGTDFRPDIPLAHVA